MDPGSAFFTRVAVPSPPELDMRPRVGVLAPGDAIARCDRAFEELGVPAARRQHLKALVLLYHDHLDASHEISQRLADRDGAYVHALMHRREGDFDNARYWFRRSGRLPFYAALHRAAGEEWPIAVRQPDWDPYLFTGECEQARFGAETEKELARVQRLEFEAIFDYTWRRQK